MDVGLILVGSCYGSAYDLVGWLFSRFGFGLSFISVALVGGFWWLWQVLVSLLYVLRCY